MDRAVELRCAVASCRTSLGVLDAQFDTLGAHARELQARLHACAARLDRALAEMQACLATG